jgi:hypothetical protein
VAIVLALTLGLLVVLSALSLANFVSVARAHAAAQIDVKGSFAILGGSGDGRLLDGGTARLRLNVSVSNPSSRSLTFDTVIYKAWIEDGPREAGVNTSRPDVLVRDGTSSRWFYLAFSGSDTSSRASIPAQATGIAGLVLDLRMAPDPYLFRGVQNITNFAVSRGTPTASLAWSIFILTSLYIDGVPPPASFTAPLYLYDVPRIVLQYGVDYGR